MWAEIIFYIFVLVPVRKNHFSTRDLFRQLVSDCFYLRQTIFVKNVNLNIFHLQGGEGTAPGTWTKTSCSSLRWRSCTAPDGGRHDVRWTTMNSEYRGLNHRTLVPLHLLFFVTFMHLIGQYWTFSLQIPILIQTYISTISIYNYFLYIQHA